MDLEIINNTSDIIKCQNTDDVLKDVCYIIDSENNMHIVQ